MKTIFGNNAPLPGNEEGVHPMDVVAQLGRTRRFNGSVNPEWTVLHHSMLVSLLWLKAYGPEGLEHILLHDAHEYVTGDIPSPVKAAIGREHIDRVQDELDRRIYGALKLTEADDIDKKCVKVVDWAALFVEAHYIGLPDHVKHLVETSISRLNPVMRQNIADVIQASTPEVLKAMETAGYWAAPFEDPTPTGVPVEHLPSCRPTECHPDCPNPIIQHEKGCIGMCRGCT